MPFGGQGGYGGSAYGCLPIPPQDAHENAPEHKVEQEVQQVDTDDGIEVAQCDLGEEV